MRQSPGLSTNPTPCSRMLGTALSEASLPFEGFGHVVLGGSGPVLIYRLAADCVRVIVDVPLDLRPRVSYGN